MASGTNPISCTYASCIPWLILQCTTSFLARAYFCFFYYQPHGFPVQCPTIFLFSGILGQQPDSPPFSAFWRIAAGQGNDFCFLFLCIRSEKTISGLYGQ